MSALVTRRLLPRARARSLLRSLLALALLCAACTTVPAPAGATVDERRVREGQLGSTQQRQVLAAGLMEAGAGSFDGAGQLSAATGERGDGGPGDVAAEPGRAGKRYRPVEEPVEVQAAAAVVPAVPIAHTPRRARSPSPASIACLSKSRAG